MAPQSRIIELASQIQHHTEEINDCLVQAGHPLPSWDLNTPPAVKLDTNGQAHQNAVLEAMHELQSLIQGPVPSIFSKVVDSVHGLSGLHAIYRLRLADAFPPGETITFADLAKRVGASEHDVSRYLRCAMTDRIFCEPSKGIVAHTSLSKALADVPPIQDVVGHLLDNGWPTAAHAMDALQKWPGSEEPTETGFNYAKNTSDTFFDSMGKDPAQAKRFASAMSLLHKRPGYELQHVVSCYDWAKLGAQNIDSTSHPQQTDTNSLVVDIGGSTGHVATALLDAFSNLQCVVQDLPEVVHSCTVPEHLQGRLSFQAHDFFADQPLKGARVYFFRWILHDWSDKYAIKILRALIPGLRPDSEIIVNEFCLPEPGELPPWQEKRARYLDIGMKYLLNARERSREDWIDLFAAADKRFEFVGISKPHMSELSFVTFKWSGVQ